MNQDTEGGLSIKLTQAQLPLKMTSQGEKNASEAPRETVFGTRASINIPLQQKLKLVQLEVQYVYVCDPELGN